MRQEILCTTLHTYMHVHNHTHIFCESKSFVTMTVGCGIIDQHTKYTKYAKYTDLLQYIQFCNDFTYGTIHS